MQQSNFIFGALAIAFLVFITVRGSLPVYLSVIFGTAEAPSDDGGKSDDGVSLSDLSNPFELGQKMGEKARNDLFNLFR